MGANILRGIITFYRNGEAINLKTYSGKVNRSETIKSFLKAIPQKTSSKFHYVILPEEIKKPTK